MLARRRICFQDTHDGACSVPQHASHPQDYKRPRELVRERPTPMFGYNSAEGYWDIPFPDFTFYGHEHSWLTGAAKSIFYTDCKRACQ